MRAGDTVECINARGAVFLRRGHRYTVEAVYGDFIAVREYPLPVAARGWYAWRFRRVPRTDIAVFLDIARSSPVLQPA